MNLIKGTLLQKQEYYTLKYDGVSISGEVFVSALLIDATGNKIFELADYIQKPEWDENGDYTGLVAGLLACANIDIKNIIISGSSQLEKHEELGNFFSDLFANFNNVASVFVESRELNTEAVNLTLEIINSKKHFYRQFSK